jgi:hypothetical protein
MAGKDDDDDDDDDKVEVILEWNIVDQVREEAGGIDTYRIDDWKCNGKGSTAGS